MYGAWSFVTAEMTAWVLANSATICAVVIFVSALWSQVWLPMLSLAQTTWACDGVASADAAVGADPYAVADDEPLLAAAALAEDRVWGFPVSLGTGADVGALARAAP